MVSDSLSSQASTALHYLPTLMLLWLAFFFGRSLRAGATPLIERIARQGKPQLSLALRRYARALTVVWSGYFILAAILSLTARWGFEQSSLAVTAVSTLLFCGEYWIRRRLFPRERFPGLVQQLRDTVSVCRPHGNA
jgi:uncharacterized membrane protein